jgi:hypothetical protein
MSTQRPGKKARRVRIEIPLRTRPKRLYCSGPPPPPIALVPPRDSTAYIVNKLVLPSGLETAANLHTQRRLYYTVGWTDPPGAKVAVLASRVLDYVSPRELEDWEYNDFLRREEEKGLAQVEAAATPKKKKPGRRRKGPSASEQEAAAAEQPAVLDSETEAILAEKKAAGGPSLSTPSKRKLEELYKETEAEETGTESENAAIMRQLYSEGDEAGYPSEAQYGEEMDIDSEAVDLLEPGIADLSSRASSLVPPIRAPFAARASPALSGSRKPSSADSSSVAFPSAPASLPDIKGKAPAGAAVRQAPTPRQEAKPRSRTSTRASTPLTAYFPAPSTNGAPPLRRESTGFTPVITPVPFPVRAPFSAQPSLPKLNISTPSADDTQPSPTASQRRPPRKRKKEEKAAEVEWKVKRLEGDKYDYDANGNLVRYFKVLWEGDWPPSQNPSWEPEENISDDLKDEYLRKKESKLKNGYLAGKSPAKSPANKPPPFLPKKRYSNVAEAFEGEIDELGGAAAGKNAEDDDDDEEDGEEMFVVTDEPQSGADRKPAPNFSAFDQKLASHRSTFGRGG